MKILQNVCVCQTQRENTVSGNSWDVPPNPRSNLDTQKNPPLPVETQAFSLRPRSGGAAEATAAPGRPRLVPRASEVTQRAPPPPLDPLLLPRRADLQEAAAASAERRWRTVWTT